ncbi:MAG: LacI family transcriptional regulator [Calditrichaeota bacterium]|nr:LacI family transcriptional regulator [Calditrichota bacterium]
MKSKKKPVTLKTLAKILNLTPATISKALRDSSDISLKTRERVKQKAKELGYQPNLLARSLIRRRSNIIGVIIPNLAHSFFAEVTRGISDRARSLGYEAIIMLHDESSIIERRNLGFLSSLNVDGILIAAVPGVENNTVIESIEDRGIPFVCFDRVIDGKDFSSVTIDDKQASFILMEKLIEQGCRKITFLGPTHDLFVAKGRFEGYQEALKKHNIPYDPEYVIECGINIDDAYVRMKRLLNSGHHFDAAITISGLLAYGAGKAILEAGLSIPDDVKLGEFGDNNIVHRLGVPFITVDQKPYEMGTKSVEMIVDLVETGEKEEPPKHVFIDTKLVCHHMNNSFNGECE